MRTVAWWAVPISPVRADLELADKAREFGARNRGINLLTELADADAA